MILILFSCGVFEDVLLVYNGALRRLLEPRRAVRRKLGRKPSIVETLLEAGRIVRLVRRLSGI